MNITAAVITVSDTRNIDNDVSGNVLQQLLETESINVRTREISIDERPTLELILKELADRDDIDLILTTGGTGLAPRDVTPEATSAIIEREVPGIAEAMRRETYTKTQMSMLSRGIAGVRNGTLIVNLPGSPKGVVECFEVLRPVLGHAVDQVRGRTSHEEK